MAWPNDKRTPGSPLGFSTEVARVGIGILGGEWLLELYGAHKMEPGDRLRWQAGKEWSWGQLVAAMGPEESQSRSQTGRFVFET